MTINTKPEPLCPNCKKKMVLRRPKLGDKWEPFWGCQNYPKCEGTRSIDPVSGNPLDDWDEVPLWEDEEDWDWDEDMCQKTGMDL